MYYCFIVVFLLLKGKSLLCVWFCRRYSILVLFVVLLVYGNVYLEDEEKVEKNWDVRWMCMELGIGNVIN